MSDVEKLTQAIVAARDRILETASCSRTALQARRARLRAAQQQRQEPAKLRDRIQQLEQERAALRERVGSLEAQRDAELQSFRQAAIRCRTELQEQVALQTHAESDLEARQRLADGIIAFAPTFRAMGYPRPSQLTPAQLALVLEDLTGAVDQSRSRASEHAKSMSERLEERAEDRDAALQLRQEIANLESEFDHVAARLQRRHGINEPFFQDLRAATAIKARRLRREVFSPRCSRAAAEREDGIVGPDPLHRLHQTPA